MTEDELAIKFGQVCDVIERTYHGWPLEDDTGLYHTSKDARAGAVKIFRLLGIEL